MSKSEILLESDEIRITRTPGAGKQGLSLLEHIFVEWGTKADWDTLCELHYKGHTLAAGSRYLRCVLAEPGEPEHLIGIMVFANPQMLSSGRNQVFAHLRPNAGGRDNKLVNQSRTDWINKNLTWNNRTVLDTMYRSAGIAYRFKNVAYRMYCSEMSKRFVESVSSMGRFNPFSIKTGMKFVKPKPPSAQEPGLRFFLGHFRSAPHDVVAIQQELAGKPEGERVFLDRRLREFYYRWSPMEKSGDKRDLGMTRIDALPLEYVLKGIMQLVFGATVYWIWEAVDKPGTLPRRMPVTAFDEQGPCEPLARVWTGEGT